MCIECKISPWHANSTCEEYKKWRTENDSADAAAEVYIRREGKKCPTCGNGIVKDGGCNHLVCRCGTHLCNICGVKLDSNDPYRHFNQGTCVTFEYN